MSADAPATGSDTPITEARLTEMLDGYNTKLAESNARMDQRMDRLAAVSTPAPVTPPVAPAQPAPVRVLTKAELDLAVDSGAINEARRDEILAQQAQDETQASEARADQRQDERATERDRITSAKAGLAQYSERIPALLDKSTAEYGQFEAAFTQLVNEEGFAADSIQTQLHAARMAFGPVDHYRAPQAKPAQTHEEVGGAAADKAAAGSGSDARPKGVTADQVVHGEMNYSGEKLKTYYEWCVKGNEKKLAAVQTA